MSKADLSQVGPILLKLTSGENLPLRESRKAFNLIGDYDESSLFFAVFTAGLMAKGPTSEEILGLCLDRRDRIGEINVKIKPSEIIDLSGGGGDKIKTINISTAACLVVATGGLSVAKQAAAAFTGLTGSSDILTELGVGVPTDKKVDRKRIKKALETLNFVAYNYASLAQERFTNFFKWRKRVISSGLKYFVPWHIASFAYSPIKMENRIYGLASPKYMRLLAEVLIRLDYKRALIVHGIDGLDEISNVGVTKVVEVKNRKTEEYTLTPEDFGIKKAKVEELLVETKNESITNFLKVIMGKGEKAMQDLVAINSGAAFYLAGKRKTLKQGTEYALKLLKEGKVANKLEEIVSFYKGKDKFLKQVKRVKV